MWRVLAGEEGGWVGRGVGGELTGTSGGRGGRVNEWVGRDPARWAPL